MIAAQENLPFDDPALPAAEQNEVVNSKEVQIRRFVPIVWEYSRLRRAAAGLHRHYRN